MQLEYIAGNNNLVDIIFIETEGGWNIMMKIDEGIRNDIGGDYVRLKTLELVSNIIYERNIEGAVAEGGYIEEILRP